MTVGELREAIREIVKRYFAGAAVKWIDENNVRPTGPLVTLQLRNIQRELFAILENRQGHPVKLWHTRAMLDVNLYTPGGVSAVQPGIRPRADNTAVSDMQDFVSYMDSDYVYGVLGPQDVTVLPEGPTQDVSELVDNAKYEYRAMQEFTVDFIQNAAGVSGILHIPARQESAANPEAPGLPAGPQPDPPTDPGVPEMPDDPALAVPLPDPDAWEPTASGGGSRELAEMDTGWFESVETENTKE
ncbi:MAG: hypothetical protein HFG24_05780 [Anaerotruncus sp.]|jgi:hypothetical protein|nr:hypothetical protein [Anaerotruncus sp.]